MRNGKKQFVTAFHYFFCSFLCFFGGFSCCNNFFNIVENKEDQCRYYKKGNYSYQYRDVDVYLKDDEVELEPEKKKQQSLYSRLRKGTKDLSQNKFAFDPNDRVSDLDRDAHKLDAVKDQDRNLLE